MNAFEFVIALVAITSVVQMVRIRHQSKSGRRERVNMLDPLGLFPGSRRREADEDDADDVETARLRDEVKMLKDRIHTLERIAVDKENSLSREIESLRDR